METWFLKRVFGLSLSVLLLGLPGPLGAWTPTNSSMNPATEGFHSSATTDELSNTESGATSTSYSSESLSPSQRNLLLSHSAETHAAPAGNFAKITVDTEQTQTFTETSSRSLEAVSLSAKPPTSTLVTTTEAGSSSSSSSSSSVSSSSVSSSSDSRSSSSSSSVSSSSDSSSSSSSISSSSDISSSSVSSSSDSSSSSSSISSSSDISSSSVSSSSSSSTSISSSSSSSSISSSSGISSSSSSSSSSTSGSRSSRDWVFTNTDQMPDISHAVSWKSRTLVTEEATLPQDSPDSTLRLGDATPLVSQPAVITDSTYTTTISRAGERTLLSVTSSSSSSSNSSTSSAFTDSHQPPSTWGVPPRTEDYTMSTRGNRGETTDRHMTDSSKGIFPETGSPEESRGTQGLTGQPNATQHQQTSTAEETSDSTPPLRMTEPGTDRSQASVSSTPPVTSAAGGPANVSGTETGSDSSVGTFTETSTGASSSRPQNQEGTETLSSQTRAEDVDLGLTAAPSTVSSSTSETNVSLTDSPVLVTEVLLTTTPVTVTERLPEDDTFKATAFTTATTTLPLPATSSSRLSSTTSTSTLASSTEVPVPYAAPSTPASTPALQTTPADQTRLATPSQTQGPSTGMATPTSATTLQSETNTGSRRITTAPTQYIATTYTPSPPIRSTEALHTTRKQTHIETTEPMATAPPTDVRTTDAPPPARDPCASNPCMNGGMCVSSRSHQFTCQCQKAWTGPTCNQDLDECERNPCPPGSKCVNTRGSFSCECDIGFDLEDGRTCTRAKTFLGTFSVNRPPHDPNIFKSATMHEIQREIIQLLNMSLSALRGYRRSTLSAKEDDGVRILAVNMFSISTDVTTAEVNNSIQMSLRNCGSSMSHCRMVLQHQLTYHVESLCVAQKTQCDTERSTCTDNNGTAYCQCLQGYYKHNPEDLSCLECGDGYKLENGTCVPCMFGFGGFNCGNFYKLIAVVVAPAGGGLLLILVIALIVTCCKKDKNDINKIIFKSGDMQMSPYADFPKNNRISMEWGRETIEMQENGSTKNLLQMSDIYYSPALRNSDLDRNGLYPFTGLPGSRHSCIYPAQWNPSFISDDSRRRDYF